MFFLHKIDTQKTKEIINKRNQELDKNNLTEKLNQNQLFEGSNILYNMKNNGKEELGDNDWNNNQKKRVKNS